MKAKPKSMQNEQRMDKAITHARDVYSIYRKKWGGGETTRQKIN